MIITIECNSLYNVELNLFLLLSVYRRRRHHRHHHHHCPVLCIRRCSKNLEERQSEWIFIERRVEDMDCRRIPVMSTSWRMRRWSSLVADANYWWTARLSIRGDWGCVTWVDGKGIFQRVVWECWGYLRSQRVKVWEWASSLSTAHQRTSGHLVP